MPIYEPNITAVLCVDLYNDFLSEGGKLFPWIKDIADEVGAIDNLRKVVAAAREAGITIFHVAHHRMEPGCYQTGSIPRRTNCLRARTRSSRKTPGVTPFTRTSRCSQAMLSALSTGPQAGSPTRISTICSSATARRRSSASASWPTLASRRQREPDRNLVTTSLWSVMQLRLASRRRCTLNIDAPTFAHEILTTEELLAAFKATTVAA